MSASLTQLSLESYNDRTLDQLAKNYRQVLIRDDRGAQAAEINEIQGLLFDQIRRLGETLWVDGDVVEGPPPGIDPQTGEVQLLDTKVYIQGQVYSVPATTLTIATSGTVSIGIRLDLEVVTEIEDPTLNDPSIATRNVGQPGAARLKVTPNWATEGQLFFRVYRVVDGVLITQDPPESPFGEIIARYDRESQGSYRVAGLEVRAIGVDGDFVVSAGTGNAFGRKVDVYSDVRLSYSVDPDLLDVASEPDVFVNGSTPVQLNRAPVEAISSVIAAKQKTVSRTRGSAGGADALPDTSVLELVEVRQGGTVYTETTDYQLDGDSVDWAPGGAEPSPGSSYDVTYRYLTSFTPQNVDLETGQFTISGAVPGQAVFTDYQWRMPRVDRICLGGDGVIYRVKGRSSRFQVVPPPVPPTCLLLATIHQTWSYLREPSVRHDGPRAASAWNQNRLEELVVHLYDLVSRERLRRDIVTRHPASQRGAFVDPMDGNSMRDLGIAQTAVIANGGLRLPVASEVFRAAQNDQVWMLPFVEVTIIEQPLETGTTLIMPYLRAEPIPATLTLDPAQDSWTVIREVWTDNQIELFMDRFSRWEESDRVPQMFDTMAERNPEISGQVSALVPLFESGDVEAIRELGSFLHREVTGGNADIQRQTSFLRVIDVAFRIEHFGSDEELTSLTFDGLNVTPSPALFADGNGRIDGQFTIPENVPVGIKAVIARGSGDSRAQAEFVGSANIVDAQSQGVSFFHDPIAQTFQLEESRWITSIDVGFRARGSAANRVAVEIRGVDNGVPAGPVLAQGVIPGDFALTGWTRITLARPFWAAAGVEYSFTLRTDDLYHAVALAELGKFDANADQWVTANPIVIGVLLKSSNNLTWTPYQTQDLTFRINAARFTANTRTVDYGPIQRLAASGITRSGTTATVVAPGHGFSNGDTVIIAGANQNNYNGAHVIANATTDEFEITVPGGTGTPATGSIGIAPGRTSDLGVRVPVQRPSPNVDVTFRFVADDAASTEYRCAPNARLELDARVTSGLRLYADLEGTEKESPLIAAGLITVLGDMQESATYVSRAIQCVETDRVEVNYDGYIPGSADVEVRLQEDAPSNPAWSSAIPVHAVTVIGDGWSDYNHRIDPFANGEAETRVQLTLTGTPDSRPVVDELRLAALFTA
ncbi:MAG: DUF4815 domain-containing protein [Cyanobacteria bacterium J06638_7]